MFIKTKRVRRANRTYEYLTLVESVRVDGKNSHRTLFRLGEATALRETGELDRIIAALTAHAERRYVDVDELEVDQAPMLGTMAAVRHLWDELDLQELFATIAMRPVVRSRWRMRCSRCWPAGWSTLRRSGAPIAGSSRTSSPRTASPSPPMPRSGLCRAWR